MFLLILSVVHVGVLLYTPGPVGAAVVYYVTPSEAPNWDDCHLLGDPCETLDHYASNITRYFAGNDNVTMIFLRGNHTSTVCFTLSCHRSSPCLRNLNMTGWKNTTSKIHLGCDFTFLFIDTLTISNVIICGHGNHGLVMNEAPAMGMMVDGVTFIGAALRFGGYSLSSDIVLNNTYFEASVVEMSVRYSGNTNITILQSVFMTSFDQHRVISLCLAGGTATLIGDGIITTSRSDVELSAPHDRCIRNSIVTADVAIDFTTTIGKFNTVITNSNFSRAHGMAFHYRMDTTMSSSYLNAIFNNIVFEHYDQGAIVLKFLSHAVELDVSFQSCIFENNTFIAANSASGSGSSGVQIIYPLHGVTPHYTRKNHTVMFQSCLFQHNTGQVILLYKSKNVTFIDCTFAENHGSSIVAFHTGYLVLSGQINFMNNSAYRGAGLVLIESTLYIEYNTTVTFYGNAASNKGGAILVEGQSISAEDNPTTNKHCFYQITRRDNTQKINFTSNFAALGGNDIYGSPLASYCLAYDQPDHQARSYEKLKTSMFHFQPKTLSSITSDPQRVCLCKDSDIPICDDIDSIFLSSYSLYPGEVFSLSMAVVGIEFGTVAGIVQANLVQSDGKVNPEYHQVLEVTECSDLKFAILHSSPSQVRMYVTIEDRYAPYYDKQIIIESISSYRDNHNIIPSELLTVPIFIDVTLLPCPPGFQLIGEPHRCDCYPQIVKFVTCEILNGTGFISRNDTIWIGGDGDNHTLFSKSCPYEYCTFNQVMINLSDPDTQCTFNRAGRLCGGCVEGYSLAIGSTHCLHCPNSSHFSLILFFVFAGLALVLLIHILNLTITQGTINGIVFYVNIIWTYEKVLFPRRDMLILPFRIFLAWLNLDFGMESCFIEGLSAFWISWIQFIFPLYILSIAGVIILMCKYSTKLTRMFGDRTVPLLVTLFLISYLKLLRTVVDICLYTTLTVYPSESKILVWYLDGNLLYGHYPHIFLLVVAIPTLMFIYMPYTLVIFSIQWLRRGSHLTALKWISKINPVFDAHLAPLKDKHHYWFGTLLIARGVLLIIFTLTSADHPEMNMLILFTAMMALLVYMLYFHFYKSKVALLLECISFTNLIVTVGSTMYIKTAYGNQSALINVSVSVMVVQFCAVIVWHCVKICCIKTEHRRGYLNIETATNMNAEKAEFNENAEVRESILTDSP